MNKRPFPEAGAISFHMPGHKYRLLFGGDPLLRYDVTELPGMDNLIEPEGWILELSHRLSEFYGSLAARILVGGSSSGILGAVLGAAEFVRSGAHQAEVRAIVNRNAHISVFNAVELAGIVPIFVSPLYEDTLPAGFDTDVLLREAAGAHLLILTYPFYQGGLYDIGGIISEVRRRNPDIIIIVDEAHGAHLVLEEKLRGVSLSSLSLGADIVVQSIHKTLPALGSTALLHYARTENGAALLRVSAQLRSVEWHLRALQTTSPSFLMLESVAQMMDILSADGVRLYGELLANIAGFYERTGLAPVRLCGAVQDTSKILIRAPRADAQDFFASRGIYPEMVAGEYTLFLCSIANTAADFDALADALAEMSGLAAHPAAEEKCFEAPCSLPSPEAKSRHENSPANRTFLRYGASVQTLPVCHCRAASRGGDRKAAFSGGIVQGEGVEKIDAAAAEGRVSLETIVLYPPGSPVIVRGEVFTREICELLRGEYVKVAL